jgi:G3E family GTPase
LLNKTDAVSKEVVEKVEGIVKTLNPYVFLNVPSHLISDLSTGTPRFSAPPIPKSP